MDRLIDAAAVLLFAGATAAVALHARGWFAEPAAIEAPAGAPAETYASRVANAIPRLERHVAAGSMRDRTMVCDERERLASIAAIEAQLGDGHEDPTTAATMAAGIRALRECVACTPEPNGCADAARAFTNVEDRLSIGPRGDGI